jgi:hypothetical protein
MISPRFFPWGCLKAGWQEFGTDARIFPEGGEFFEKTWFFCGSGRPGVRAGAGNQVKSNKLSG